MLVLVFGVAAAQERPRARDVGLVVGVFPTGQLNTITDVDGVKVGHSTIIEGDDIRTGVTAIILGAWTPDAKGLTMRALIGLLLTAVASGLGGFTLGRGLFRIKTERATDA